MVDDLLLLSGNDIPFVDAKTAIHQPKCRQIAYMTEQNFWTVCGFLKFDKDILLEEQKKGIEHLNNFEIIMMILHQNDIESHLIKANVISLFTLLFPQCSIDFYKEEIVLRNNNTGQFFYINKNNYEIFKNIIVDMFCLIDSENKQYNPQGEMAKRIADQFKRASNKRSQLAPSKKIAILSRYISVLAVAQKKNIPDLLDYTVYQLMDEFKRFELKSNYDSYEKYTIAGAKDLKTPEDWFKDIH